MRRFIHGGHNADGGDHAGSACSRSRKHDSVGRRPPARQEHLSSPGNIPGRPVCDFTYHNEFTITINAVIFPDGTEIDQDVIHATHTNMDTGFVLTETDYFSDQFRAGQEQVVGIQWHLRTPNGKLIVVHAGNIVLSSTGDVVSFTPNINPDFAAVICPALGGHPA